MNYAIIHHPEKERFETTVDGFTGIVTYKVINGILVITHTLVPSPIEGQGVAAALVKNAFDYAREKGLSCMASCSYANAWLHRHPTYRE
ncbi:N-acetyltransferase [Parabacteroides sp. 52]|uniref:GNAT family N-acetyltransferase n=1 Tax=unclassified Parabacteroides TaxID=2649774 RepID=UPI0013D1DD73|nr:MULTISPECIES: GNAT family N-acetyltransferase [unclassified Parabacteroides]MDH6534170.1 putative GNAT family acetyltransferase [Parabacteroides sp. PM5-20]NDV54928.1 N-acetyltransferase [Parabacteroides sp. 52]